MKKLLPLLFAFFLPLNAFALSTDTFYIDSDCANSGDGSSASCAGSPGGAGAYKTIAGAITARQTDLVAADKIHLFYVEGTAIDTWDGTLGTYTTDATRIVKIVGNTSATGRHTGVWGSTFTVSNSNYNGAIIPTTSGLWVENIQIQSTGNDDCRCIGLALRNTTPAGSYWFVSNIIRYNPSGTTTTSTSNSGIFVDQVPSGTRKTYFINNIIYGFRRNGMTLSSGANEQFYVYNNTISGNCLTGGNGVGLFMYGSSDTFKLRDNIIVSNGAGTQYYTESSATSYTTAKNVTSDGSSPDGASYQTQTCTFTGAPDYHLSGSDACARDRGDDLSADGDFAFSTDAEGTTRPQNGTWDIGADEVTSGGGGGGSAATVLLIDAGG